MHIGFMHLPKLFSCMNGFGLGFQTGI